MNVTKKKKFGHIHQGIYVPSGLEKINSTEFLEVKLLAENPCQWWKIEYFPKGEDHLIKKAGTYPLDVWYTVKDFIAD